VPASRQKEVDAAVADVDFTKNSYQIEFDTNQGPIRLDLWPDVAPGHCRNIIGLTRIGFYDGIISHRVIPGFMMQAGCPQGTGTGGPGYTIKAEFNSRIHEAGVLSMARTSQPDTAGSQFFICFDRAPHLDRQYTAFGQTADEASLATVKKIEAIPTDHSDRPKQEVKIVKGRVNVTSK
jgi:cyclophilin family peptidyl-prolyl cis-trans isomerase